MRFADAEAEIRSRFAEAAAMINHARSIEPPIPEPVDDMQKALRALCLVVIYAAFERGVNSIVETALSQLSMQATKSIDYIPSMHSVIHYARVQSLNACGSGRLMDVSSTLFEASLSEEVVKVNDNPFSDKLQNVDAGTVIWIAKIFGIAGFDVLQPDKGRLGTLRERRNAVAHGREAASKVGERYSIDELAKVYEAADKQLIRFLFAMEEHCSSKKYLRQTA